MNTTTSTNGARSFNGSVSTTPPSTAQSTPTGSAPVSRPPTTGGGNNFHQQQQQRDTTFTKIFVGGLPYSTTDDSLGAFFEQFGPIDEAVVITDRQTGRSRGYGFVTMAHQEDALKAIRDPNPCIDGRKANVNLAVLGAKPRLLPGVNCVPMPLLPFQTSAPMMPNNPLMNPLLTSAFLSNLGMQQLNNNGMLQHGGQVGAAGANGPTPDARLHTQLSLQQQLASPANLLMNNYASAFANSGALAGTAAGQSLSTAALAQLLLSNSYCQGGGQPSPGYHHHQQLGHTPMSLNGYAASVPTGGGHMTSNGAVVNGNGSMTGGVSGGTAPELSSDVAYSTALAYQRLLTPNAFTAYNTLADSQQQQQVSPSMMAATAALFGVDPSGGVGQQQATALNGGGNTGGEHLVGGVGGMKGSGGNSNGGMLIDSHHMMGANDSVAAALNSAAAGQTAAVSLDGIQQSYAAAAAAASNGSSLMSSAIDNADLHVNRY